jgi:Na+/H+ antiporter NhaD/arsenite permease-like protein
VALDSGIKAPFITFIEYLVAPTLVNLLVTYWILKVLYRRDIPKRFYFSAQELSEKVGVEYDRQLATISVTVLIATISGFVISELLQLIGIKTLSLSAIALIGAAAIYALSGRRIEIMKRLDYSVLIFFAAMFVVTTAMWQSGAVSKLLLGFIPSPNPNDLEQSAAIISIASIGVSQILSNVPFVALYNFVLINGGFDGTHISQWMMLAAASTIAGNLTILGAASNIIILEAAESRQIRAFSFTEFLKAGSIVTVANLSVYYFFIVFVYRL